MEDFKLLPITLEEWKNITKLLEMITGNMDIRINERFDIIERIVMFVFKHNVTFDYTQWSKKTNCEFKLFM